jgi:hypothetical protein
MSKLKTISEGLRAGDLKNMISPRFTVDQYKSKMGADRDVIVLAFQIKEKFAAIDVMEFVEKSYEFILDADMSTGEEQDGTYRMFVELERKPVAAEQIRQILKGLDRLCDIDVWRFRYHKSSQSHEYTIDNAQEHIPLDAIDYQTRVNDTKKKFASEVINQGSATVAEYGQDDRMVVERPFAQPLEFKVEELGLYEHVIAQIQGAVQLDDKSASEVVFLEKFLGNRDIHKIDNKFVIRNGDLALAVSMKR